jgi:hypothetical protein
MPDFMLHDWHTTPDLVTQGRKQVLDYSWASARTVCMPDFMLHDWHTTRDLVTQGRKQMGVVPKYHDASFSDFGIFGCF